MVVEYSIRNGAKEIKLDPKQAKLESLVGLQPGDYGLALMEKLRAAEKVRKIFVDELNLKRSRFSTPEQAVEFLEKSCALDLIYYVPFNSQAARLTIPNDIVVVRNFTTHSLSCISLSRCSNGWSVTSLNCTLTVKNTA